MPNMRLRQCLVVYFLGALFILVTLFLPLGVVGFVQKYFKKEFNKELRTDIEKKRAQIEEEREEKERVTKRTFKIKDEILLKDYIPDDKNNSIMGKSYREAKNKFEKLGKTFKRGGKKKKTRTKKYKN